MHTFLVDSKYRNYSLVYPNPFSHSSFFSFAIYYQKYSIHERIMILTQNYIGLRWCSSIRNLFKSLPPLTSHFPIYKAPRHDWEIILRIFPPMSACFELHEQKSLENNFKRLFIVNMLWQLQMVAGDGGLYLT